MVKIRLRRMGAKKDPRSTASSSRIPARPATARSLKSSGTTIPLTDPAEVKVDGERAQYWLKNGAQPTDTVRGLLKKSGAIQ